MSTFHRPAILALSLLAAGACAPRPVTVQESTQQQPVSGAPLLLDVHNSMPHAMNISYVIGGAVTVLGSVGPNETKHWQLPNQGGDSVRLLATDEAKTHQVEKTMDLDHDKAKLWDLK